IQRTLSDHFPHLRPAQTRGLALWVSGAILAHSACQNAILAALAPLGNRQTLRHRLRATFRPDADAPAAWHAADCFVPLMRWLLCWWHAPQLAPALDATSHGDRLVVLAISVLYRGTAIPVAWHVLPAQQEGEWGPHWLRLLAILAPALPAPLQVLVFTDR